MYGIVAFFAWAMFGMVALVFLAEFVDMFASARRRRHAGRVVPAAPGGFNLRPHESSLRRFFDHKTRTAGGHMSGLNKID